MLQIDERTDASRLTEITAPGQVEEWLKDLAGDGIFSMDAAWLPVGRQRSNAGSIEASADEINPLVERLVNSKEAVIELAVRQSSYGLPGSPRAALEGLFNIPRGRSRDLYEESRAANG